MQQDSRKRKVRPGHPVFLIGALLAAALAGPVGRSSSASYQSPMALDTRVSFYTVSAGSLVNALTALSKRFSLPMGIEWVRDKQTTQGINFACRDDTLTQILRRIIAKYPGYTFDVQNGVVHVFRADLLRNTHNFLNRRVPKPFDVHNEVGGVVNQQLQEAARRIVSPQPVVPGAGEGGSYGTGLEEKPLTLVMGGRTFRQALDRLVAASEHKIWIVTFSDVGLTPTGFLRTETLWHPSPFPDSQQPMWDLMASGK
jgi:hypothetical protein